MEPIIPTNHIPPASPEVPVAPPPPEPNEEPHLAHTYQDDLARAMDATDATVVQELLATAREKEAAALEEKAAIRKRSAYMVGSVVFILLALGAVGYGVYHYMKLTVPVEKAVSVGVFPSTDPIVAATTDVRKVVGSFTKGDIQLLEEKPYLISLVHNTEPQFLLSNDQLFSFIEASPTEPFATSIDLIRWGVVHTGSETVPFIVASLSDPEKGVREFTLAEPDMLTMFYKALNIDITTPDTEGLPGFKSEYLYNLPVRSLHTAPTLSGTSRLVLLYGYATERIVVITTKPEVLKLVYDTIIKQR